ncbi:MAG: 4Fe-4S ferredoxin iron-sulfur binding protein [Sporomusa sp.]|nr:4Fe-4S ferredoxin iron-sulfur binding protein [Sporomusa sp.]
MNSFIIADPNKCIGCRTCEIACVLAHSPEDALINGTIDKSFYPRLSVIKTATVSAPVQCRHCEDAPCANVCPHGAIVNVNNTIQIDSDACIGCKTCMLACPFGAIDLAQQCKEGDLVWQHGLNVVDEEGEHAKEKLVGLKCDLCIGRKEGPACKGVCPTNAFTAVEGKLISASITKKRQSSALELARLPGGNSRL